MKIPQTKIYSIYKNLVLQDKRSKKLDFGPDGREHYVYRITDYTRDIEEHYYGSHTPKKGKLYNNLINEFWSYRTSSNYNILNENKRENYKVKIIRVFNNPADKIVYEAFLHQYFDVKLHNCFWNRSNQTPFRFDRTGMEYIFTQQHRERLKGPKSEDHKRKMSVSVFETYANGREKLLGDKNPMYGKDHTYYVKDLISKANKGKTLSQETKNKMSKSKIGIKRTDEDKIKMSENRKGKCKGEDNTMTKKIEVFDANNKLMFISEGNFKSFCEEKNLPYISFIKNFNKKIYQSKIGPGYAKKNGFEKYIGWKAIRYI